VTIADFVADVRAPTPSAAAELVVAAKDEFCGRIDRLTQRLRTAAAALVQRRRTAMHLLVSRRGLAGWPARAALRGRHVAELTFELRREMADIVRRRERALSALRQRLEARDLRQRFASIRRRLEAADGRIHAAVRRRQADARASAAALAARLDTLSPLGVLARGYAVCWNVDRTSIVRRAVSVSQGDRVRVTLHEGELECEVRSTRERRES
jgi:exodeoxyribonuclease VII large subunit